MPNLVESLLEHNVEVVPSSDMLLVHGSQTLSMGLLQTECLILHVYYFHHDILKINYVGLWL